MVSVPALDGVGTAIDGSEGPALDTEDSVVGAGFALDCVGTAIEGSEGPALDTEDAEVGAGFALDAGDDVEDAAAVVGVGRAGVGKVIAGTEADEADEAVAEQD